MCIAQHCHSIVRQIGGAEQPSPARIVDIVPGRALVERTQDAGSEPRERIQLLDRCV